MAKHKTSTNLKGILDFSISDQMGTMTEITKDQEKVYDLLDILNKYNGKTISISIRQEEEIVALDE